MRVRFAPSPTGSLHIGGARTALYNYLIAKRSHGSFIMRIEDTDRERNVPSATAAMLKDLAWLGMTWDEGPQCDGTVKGNKGPYYQSERHALYQRHAHELLDKGLAYYCFLNDEQLDQLKEEQMASGGVYQVKSPYRDMPIEEARIKLKTSSATVRMKVDVQKTYRFADAVRGDIELPASMVGDFVILRSCGSPVYNFCCVVDDHHMDMTDVLRGEEHLPNTLKQMMIYDALGWVCPSFAHLSVIVGEDRKKLSKREASVSVAEFRDQGYLPEALNNFIALLGWSHPDGQEIFSLTDMEQAFDLKRLHASAAFFDRTKLKWMNAQYLRSKTTEQIVRYLTDRSIVDLGVVTSLQFSEFWDLYKSDCETLVDIELRFNELFCLSMPSSLPEDLMQYAPSDAWKVWHRELTSQDGQLDVDKVQAMVKTIQAESGKKGKALFVPLRWVILGKMDGADVKKSAVLLSRKELVRRVEFCLELV